MEQITPDTNFDPTMDPKMFLGTEGRLSEEYFVAVAVQHAGTTKFESMFNAGPNGEMCLEDAVFASLNANTKGLPGDYTGRDLIVSAIESGWIKQVGSKIQVELPVS